jgi:uncharacterized SAM-binding protein YcdF (DUF218 family)
MKKQQQTTSTNTFQNAAISKQQQIQIKGGNNDFVITEDWLDI